MSASPGVPSPPGRPRREKVAEGTVTPCDPTALESVAATQTLSTDSPKIPLAANPLLVVEHLFGRVNTVKGWGCAVVGRK
jgi:hypothetical protein